MNWLLGITNKTVQHVTLQMPACEKLKVFFLKNGIISKNLWPPRSPDLTPADFFLWGLSKSKVYKNTPPHNRTTQRRYRPRDWSRQRRRFGNSIPEFGETHSSVFGCERRPFSVSIMSRSCFASFPVCVYKFSSHYLNNIIFYRQQFGASCERISLYKTPLPIL